MFNKIFCLEILNKLGNLHRNLMSSLEKIINTFTTNKDIYEFINNYINNNNLSKAFPIGISINQVVAHDSFHEFNLIKLNKGDYIKIDVGLIESGNIIDCARTFVYNSEKTERINNSKIICETVENFIRNQIKLYGKIQIQKISEFINALIISHDYNNLNFLGGHTIEFGKVHGKHVILNKPLKILPKEAVKFIDSNAEIGDEEMFAIEIYIPENNTPGDIIKSITIPITHYQINLEEIPYIKLKENEKNILSQITKLTDNLVYEYFIHENFDSHIIRNLIEKNAIIKHNAIEFKCNNSKNKIKYIQYEDCFLIRDKQLFNLSK